MYVVEIAERLDAMSSVKLGGFRSQLEVSGVSSHTEVMRYYETICLWMTIYTLPSQGLTTLTKGLTAATRVIQSSSNELSTLASDCAKCYQTKANTYAL